MLSYSIRKLTPEDLGRVGVWLSRAHVRAWRSDASRELALIKQDMDNPKINMCIVETSGQAFAYLHDHDAHAFHMLHFADLPQGTRVIDTFVGDPDYMSEGHETAYITEHVRDLRQLYPMVAVAPSTTDSRTISIYAHAGFRKHRLGNTRDGRLVQVMTFR